MTPAASLSIAGSSSAVSRPGRANSGYVLQTPGATIAADMGAGAFAQMRRFLNFSDDLDAVVISHMHADHFIDLIQLRYALKYELRRERRLPVYLPPAGVLTLAQIAHPLKETPDFFGEVFDLQEYGPDSVLEIGDCSLSFAATQHYIPAYALRAESPSGTFVYSSDTAPCDAVAQLARGADVFLCEAALGALGVEDGAVKGHSSARDAGEMAAVAGVNHLVVTHYSASAGPLDLLSAARSVFEGEITIADDGLEIPLVQPVLNEHV
jgi:ribonuclease BN (tRNA processing enzyme)